MPSARRVTKPSASDVVLDPAPTARAKGESDVAAHRRAQIVDAAVEIIANQGIHKLSLSNIETRVQMSRGHLTYYFRTKDEILLAVLERLIAQMRAEAMRDNNPQPMSGRAWDCFQFIMAKHLGANRPDRKVFLSLIHTFHAQIGYRDDVRRTLAELNAQWRRMIAADFAMSVPKSPIAPEVAASMVMAVLQGVDSQLSVDDTPFDKAAMLETILTLMAPMFGAKYPAVPTRKRR